MPRLVTSSSARPASRSAQVRIVASGVVELVGHTRHGLPQRRQLLRLEQLAEKVASLILELASFADVTDQRLEPWSVPCGGEVEVGGDLDPERRIVRPPQTQQVVGHRAVAVEPFTKRRSRLLVDEPRRCEGTHRVRLGLGRVSEHQFQVGVGGDRDVVIGAEETDIDPFVNTIEERGERVGERSDVRARTTRGAG